MTVLAIPFRKPEQPTLEFNQRGYSVWSKESVGFLQLGLELDLKCDLSGEAFLQRHFPQELSFKSFDCLPAVADSAQIGHGVIILAVGRKAGQPI